MGTSWEHIGNMMGTKKKEKYSSPSSFPEKKKLNLS
jgi:hypothetical protein